MYDLSPSPKFKAFYDATSIPLVGGQLFTYAAGTSANPANYQTTYKDSIATANTNPVILDSNGECDLWLGDLAYKYVLKDSVGNELWTVDNIVSGSGSIVAAISALYLNTFAALATTPAVIGQTVTILSHTSGNIGGGDFRGVAQGSLIPDGGTISASATAGVYWKRVYDGFVVNITWFGIIPTSSGSDPKIDTTTIQQAVWDNPNIRGIYYPNGRYYALTITKANPSLEIVYGDNAAIIGTATSATRCLFELKTGNGFHISGIKFAGAQNQNYTCGMHWYTNNLSLYYPGKACVDIEIGEFLIGLVVGMLPSQTTYYSQNQPQANGIAIDAPVSENKTRFRIQDCPRAIWFSQPNGKVTLTDSYIEATAEGWTLATRPAQSTYEAIVLERFGEITMSGGFLENITSTSGSLIRMNSGNIMLDNVVLESSSACRFKGNYFALRMSKLANFGYNSTTRPMFIVQSDSAGTIDVDNSWLAFPFENMRVGLATLAKGVSDITTEAYAEAPNTLITLTDVELRDAYGRNGGAWEMPSYGVKLKYSNVRHTSFSNPSVEVTMRIKDAKLSNSSQNHLASLIDNSNSIITAYPVAAPSTTGGWTFAGSGTYSYGRQAPAATLNLETLNGSVQTPSFILRMQANAAGSVTATSPSFNCEAFSYIFITGWVYVAAGGGAISGVKAESRDFSDALISTQSVTLGAVNLLNPGWQPFTGWCQQVATGSKIRLVLDVENGSDLQWFGISAYTDK